MVDTFSYFLKGLSGSIANLLFTYVGVIESFDILSIHFIHSFISK